LLGVADDGSLAGYELQKGADPQSDLGQLLNAEVEPLPPFVAAARKLDGVPLVVVRVFESADTPHLLRRTGAVPIRTPKGTENVTDQRLLLDLARRGEEAMSRARERLSMDLIAVELAAPERPDIVAVGDAEPYAIVRAGLATPMPHFAAWATSLAASRAATATGREAARILGIQLGQEAVDVSARGRGVAVSWAGGSQVAVRGRVAIDAGGVVGARISRGIGTGIATLESFRSEYISPLVLSLGDLLERAEVFGRTVWRLDIGIPPQDFRIGDAPRQRIQPFYASGQAASPAKFPDAARLTDSWWREFAREMGVEAWEP
jgi:hypothetical protein